MKNTNINKILNIVILSYLGKDNDDYVNGQGFCCDDTPQGNVTKVVMQNDNPELFQYYYHSDHLGSTSLITNLDGEVVQHVEYVPFGEVFIEERNNTWNTPYLFNAKELDEETGLYYYGARYYEPRVSLWLSTDPMQEKYPHINTYSYCAQNPIKFTDIEGLDIVLVGNKNSSVTLKTDLINIKVNVSSLDVNFGGNYTLQGEDILSAGLDIVGIFDPTGIADGINAGLQAKNGDYWGALISGIGLIPYAGDLAKVGKVGKDIKIINNAIEVLKANKISGKLAESNVTQMLVKQFGKEATVGEQITARFADGSKVVFDNVVVKNGKVLLVNETKSGAARLSKQQQRFFEKGESVEIRRGNLILKGRLLTEAQYKLNKRELYLNNLFDLKDYGLSVIAK